MINKVNVKTKKHEKQKKVNYSKGILSLAPSNKLFDYDVSDDLSEYERFLKLAFDNNQVHNFAITGNHGVGKSSIIRSFETKDKNRGKGYLYISLMDFNNNRGTEYTYLKENEGNNVHDKKQLQQEFERYLLCQILSRVDAQNLPQSTFRLIPSKRRLIRTVFSLLIAIAVLCLFGIISAPIIGISSLMIKIFYCIIAGIGTVLAFALSFILSRNFISAKFIASYGGMKVETQMQRSTGSYIDDHIFEIVYALETLANEIGYTVVLEDMDRLGRYICVDIFSKLRRINCLVNDRKKLKGKYMRFVYAFDDSIFELTKNTKFFDYVMSVTPKLNYNTGGKYFKDLILQSLSEENFNQSKLKSIIEQYDYHFWEYIGFVIHDYRMLNHIRNDFQLFVDIMLKRDFEPNTKWLPFVIYKNVLSEDYCKAFDQKGILELDKETRNKRIENLCSDKSEEYSECVKLLFEYLIDEIKLNGKDFHRFTGLPPKVINIRNISNDYSIFKDFFNYKIEKNIKILEEFLSGKKVLVTGGGPIGSEICRQIISYSIETLIIVDISEDDAYKIQMELLANNSRNRFALYIEIASIRDETRIDEILKKYQPDIIFHTAMYKHNALMENNPEEAIKYNIIGTYNIVSASSKYHVKKFIFIYTDKVELLPRTVTSATTRFCELLISSRKKCDTVFCSVRLPKGINAVSTVVSLFKRQVEMGGPITITHKDVVCYFKALPKECQLILEAAAIANESKIFVVKEGTPVKIVTLAENLIRSYGLTPYEDINIVEVGLKPGQKLYEEMLISDDKLKETEIEDIFIYQCDQIIDSDEVERIICRLKKGINMNVEGNKLMTIVKDFLSMYS